MKSKFLVMFWAFFILLGGMSFFLAQYPILLIPFIILCVAAPLSMIMMAKSGNNAEKLLKNGGIKTTARIVNIQDTGMTLNNVNIGIRLTLDVASVTGSPFQAQAETFVSRVAIPRVGDVVEVVYDPTNTSQVAIVMA